MSMLSGGGISAGTAYVDISPNFANFGGQLAAGVNQASRQAGAALESNLSQSAARANTSMSSVGQGLMMLGGQAGPVGALFTQFGDKVALGFSTAAKGAESARSRIGAAMEGIGLAATGLGVILQGFAGPLEKANADLSTVMTNAGQSVSDYAGQIKAADTTQQHFGFTNADTNEALSKLVGATGDTTRSFSLLNDATIIAKQRHMDLTAAATMLASAWAGNFRAAKQLGINITGATDTVKAADAADKAYTATVTALGDAQQRLADFEAQVAQKRQAAQEAYAANVSAANDRIANSEQHVSDLRQQFADADVAAQQRITDAETNLANVRQTAADNNVAAQQRVADAIQLVSDAQAQASDNQAQAEQSVVDAQQRLADLQQSQALTNNPRAAAADARQVALRNAQDAVVKAKQHSGEVSEADAKSVGRAEANVGKAQTGAETVAEAGAKSVAAAQLAVGKAQADAAKQAKSEDEQILKAQEAVLKAQAELAKIVRKGDGSTMTLAEQQQEARLKETVGKDTAKNDAALAKKDQADAAAAEYQKKFNDFISQLEKKYGGIPEAQSKTFAGKIDSLLAGIKDFLAKAGEKLAQPLMTAGPMAFVAGALLKGRGGKGIAQAAGGLGSDAAGAATMAGDVGAAGAAPLAVGTDVGAAFAATAPAAGAAGAEGAAGLAAILGPAALVVAAVAAIGAGLYELYKNSKGFHDFVDGAWQKTQAVIKGAWHGVIQPAWNEMWHLVADYLIPFAEKLWHGISDAWRFISDAISMAWRDVIKPVWDALYGFIRDYLIVEFDILKFGVQLVWAVIKDAISIAWNVVIKPIWDLLVAYVKDILVPVFHFIYDNAVKPVMDTIGAAISWAWDKVIHPAWEALKGYINNDLLPVFRTIGQVWSDVWSGVQTGIQDAIKFIGGLVADFLHVVANIAGAVGAGNTQKVLDQAANSVRSSTSGASGGSAPAGGHGGMARPMATGGGLGQTPIGPGFVTSEETAIVHEGGPHPEYVIPTDPAHRDNARKLYESLGAKLMAAGGVLWPFPTHGREDRVDEGWDLQEGAGGPVLAILAGRLGLGNRDPGGFGNDYPWETFDQAPPGVPSDTVYYGHTHVLPGLIGAHVDAGQQIAVTNTTDPQNGSAAPPGWLEIGFAQHGTGNPLQHGGGATGAGQAMKNLLTGAPSGSGGGGFFSGIGNAISGLVNDALSGARAALDALPKLGVPDDILGILPAAANMVRQAVIDSLGVGGTAGEQTGGLLGLTAGPVGAINTPNDFAVNLLQALGDPVTQANVASIVAWENREGGNWHNTARYNPLNTTQPEPGYSKTGSQGDIGAYVSWQQGIQATIDALSNGRYGDILGALHTGGGLGSGHYPGLLTWSGHGYDHLARGGTLGAHWAGTMDQGGVVPPGVFVGVNNTGANENLRPTGDAAGIDYERLASSIAAALARTPPNVILDGKQLSRSLHDRRLAYS